MQRPPPVVPARGSWNLLGHSDGSTATGSLGSHGPGSSDDNRRRGLDTFSSPEDEHARSAVLLRFPCEQYHTGITNWINNLWETSNIPACNKLVCKTGSLSVRLVFETRAKCQDFMTPFCNVTTNIAVHQSKSLEDREIGKRFAPLWRVLAEKLEALFPDGDDTGSFIVPALDVRSQVLSIKDRRNRVGKPVFKVAPLGNGQVFAFTAPDLHVPGIPDGMLQQVISQASTANV